MQAFERPLLTLFCHEADLEDVIFPNPPLRRLRVLNAVHVFSLTYGADESLRNTLIGRDMSLERYLDRFYLLTPCSDPERRQEVLDAFFESIADEYESLIPE